MSERSEEQLLESIRGKTARLLEFREKSMSSGLSEDDHDEIAVLKAQLKNDADEYHERFGNGIDPTSEGDVQMDE